MERSTGPAARRPRTWVAARVTGWVTDWDAAPPRRRAIVVGATVVALGLGGVAVVRGLSGHGDGHPPAAEQAAGKSHCGPISAKQVHGRRAKHLPEKLTRFWGDEAICRGMWLGGRQGHFVPQGFAIQGRTGWVTGYDGSAPKSKRSCRLVKIDLRRLEIIGYQHRIRGGVPGRRPTYCRHGGGVVADGPKRLWVVEHRRLWLLDPAKVGTRHAVRRVWRLEDGVRGSVGVMTPKGLGLGRHAARGRLDWFDPVKIRRSKRTVLRARQTERAPRGVQGLTYGNVHPRASQGVWITRSNTRCGVLQGPRGQKLPVAPGAEGIAFDGKGGLWMLSEASVRRYYDRGDPVVPQLVRYSVRDLAGQMGLPGGQRKVKRCLS